MKGPVLTDGDTVVNKEEMVLPLIEHRILSERHEIKYCKQVIYKRVIKGML